MAQARVVIAAGSAPRESAHDALAPAPYAVGPSDEMLSVPGLLARVAVASLFVIAVLIAANLVMLRILG